MNDLQIILANTDDGGNIGAVCRCMKNMGIGRLTLVGGREYDTNRISVLAVHAFEVYQNAQRTAGLEEAAAGSVLTVGVTRRRGRRRKYRSLTPEELAERLAELPAGEVSLVFGNEEHGLTDEELKVCDTAVHIPSSPEFPSLNLSHAVQVVLYVLFRRFAGEQSGGGAAEDAAGIPRRELDVLVDSIAGDLGSIGFFTLTGREEMHIFLRDLFARAGLTPKEAGRLQRIFRKIRDLKLHRPTT